jgi:hypothetical protein
VTAGPNLNLRDGVGQTQMGRDAHGLAAVAEKQLGDAGHRAPYRRIYKKSIPLF